MRARDLASEVPTVTQDTNAWSAARLLSHEKLPGLIVLDGAGRPFTVLPGSQVLRYLVPQYVQDEPPLARAYDEKASDELCAKLTTSTGGQRRVPPENLMARLHPCRSRRPRAPCVCTLAGRAATSQRDRDIGSRGSTQCR